MKVDHGVEEGTVEVEYELPHNQPAVFRARVDGNNYVEIPEVFYRSSNFSGQLGSVILMLMTQTGADKIIVKQRRTKGHTMNTYRYEIAKHADEYRVTEADGPWAKATGTYATREAAEAAIEAVAGKPLDFDYSQSEGIEHWNVEFEA